MITKKRSGRSYISHCCITVLSRGITAAIELDVPLTTTTTSNKNKNNGIYGSMYSLPNSNSSSSFSPATIGTNANANDPYAPPKSPPLSAKLKDYWSGTGTILPPDGVE